MNCDSFSLSLFRFGVTQAKFQANQNVSTKAMLELSFRSSVGNNFDKISSPSTIC